MGCDIHGVFQAKVDGEWVDIEQEDLDRNYLVFGWIAGVRMDEEDGVTPIARPRGFPDDFVVTAASDGSGDYVRPTTLDVMRGWERRDAESGEGLTEIWMGDHSFSWVLASEVLTAQIPERPHPRGVDEFFNKCLELQNKHGEVRFVFGFDS